MVCVTKVFMTALAENEDEDDDTFESPQLPIVAETVVDLNQSRIGSNLTYIFI